MKLIDTVVNAVTEHGNLVFGIVGVAVLFASSVLIYNTRPKVDKLLEERKEKIEEIQNDDTQSEIEKQVAIKEVNKDSAIKIAKTAAPAVLVLGLTAACQVTSIIQSENKIKDATSTALVATTAYDKLYDKTKETVGEEKAKEIQNEALKEELEERYSEGFSTRCFEQAAGGNVPFIDSATGKLILSDEVTIMNACNMIRNQITKKNEPYCSFNELYTNLDLEQVVCGNYIGFNEDTLPEPDFQQAIKIGDVPVTVIRWRNKFYSIKAHR
jgi:hypothetical protein